MVALLIFGGTLLRCGDLQRSEGVETGGTEVTCEHDCLKNMQRFG